MNDKDYICPQCGPDPRGGAIHAAECHTFPELTDWQLGGIAMLRSMKATLQLLREGKWTLEQAEQWVEEQLK